jgi:hypothetical protein
MSQGDPILLDVTFKHGLIYYIDTRDKCCHLKIMTCIVGYNEFAFFFKMKNTDPLMGEKLKSKKHLQYRFF